MQHRKVEPPIAAADIDDARRRAQSCGCAAEALDALATVAKNELDSLRGQMRDEALSSRYFADWETFQTVPVLLDLIIAQAAAIAAAATAIEMLGLPPRAAA